MYRSAYGIMHLNLNITVFSKGKWSAAILGMHSSSSFQSWNYSPCLIKWRLIHKNHFPKSHLNNIFQISNKTMNNMDCIINVIINYPYVHWLTLFQGYFITLLHKWWPLHVFYTIELIINLTYSFKNSCSRHKLFIKA